MQSPSSVPVDRKIISQEMIKPSKPTPNHLTTYKCSFLDQLAPAHYLPFILLYQPTQQDQTINHTEILQHLKTSLSNTLPHFYFLAGKLSEDGYSINCDDEGILFLEAHINGNLSELIEKADYKHLNQCLPNHEDSNSDRKILVVIQFNVFTCGGIGIGINFSHKAGDGHSATTFLKSWANSCKSNSQETILPKLIDAANYFPPTDASKYKPVTEIPPETNLIAKRFLFTQSSLNKLKQTISSSLSENIPSDTLTSTELISAFILRRVMEINETKPPPKRMAASLYYVNLRDKMNPPLPKEAFGNFWRLGLATPNMFEMDSYDQLVSKMRKAIDGIGKEEYIEKLKNGKDQRMEIFLWAVRKGPENSNIDSFIFTSWLDFGVYDVDFGFGKVDYVCSPSRPRRNMVTLMGTKDGEGIEVWINMTEGDMKAFESDEEVVSMTSTAE